MCRVVNEFFRYSSRRGASGWTGETYAFDRKGLMLSESLFEGQLREIGLLREDQGYRDESGAPTIPEST